MKVMLINAVCGTGSTGKIVTDLHHVLREAGEQACIAYGVGNAVGAEQGAACKIANRAEYLAHNACSRLTDHAGFYSAAATRRLIQLMDQKRPDVVHLHNLHGYYLHVELLFRALKQRGIPVVWTLHDCWAFTGHCAHYVSVDCSRWKTGCYACPLLHRYPRCVTRGDVERNYIRKKNCFTALPGLTLVTPSQWLAQQARASFLGDYPVRVIPNGIDLEQFRPVEQDIRARYGLQKGRLLLGVASVWSERKGLRDFAALAERLPAEDRIVLIGVSEAQRAALPPQILALPRTADRQELAAFYTAADVFLNPSYEETMGMTTVEAMACGTPVIVYDRTALPETVDERSGVVVPAGDVDALARAIDSACALPPEGPRARAAHYEKTKQYRQYLELYRQISR